MLRRRILSFATLALAVPVPALALTGGEGETPAALSVSASLDTCGVAETTIVCKIDASWGSLEGAEYYTASVTRADGSVVDYGQVGAATGTSLWVPYVGAGTYTVRVSAYGTPPDEEKPELIAEDTASSGGEDVHRSDGSRDGGPEGDAEPGAGEDSVAGEEPGEEPPPNACEQTEDEQPGEGDGPAQRDEPAAEAGIVDAKAAELGKLPDAATAALAAEAELPESVDCPAPAE
jgi:hypothetical protein